MQTGNSGELRSPVGALDTRGKHRVSAELKRLEQETRFLEVGMSENLGLTDVTVDCSPLCQENEELEQLDRMEKASAACKEMLSNIETRPDPLRPVTNGPINPTWDRWFEGPQDSSGCRCRIL